MTTAKCCFCEDKAELPFTVYASVLDGLPKEESIKDGEGTPLRACADCSTKFHGRLVADPKALDQDEPTHRLILEHDDFQGVSLKDLTSVVKAMKCQLCGNNVGANNDDAYDFARDVLRICPGISTDPDIVIKWTCADCTSLGICPCCNEDDVD